MADKYSDLTDQIREDADKGPVTSFGYGIEYAMLWLDEHPDQAPGRTITVSEFDEAVESCITEDATVPPHTFAARLGVVCVPDPVPTNAEKLADILRRYDLYSLDDEGVGEFARMLSEDGVKAPEADDG